MLCTVIVITGLCDLVKTVMDVINDSSEVPNYQIISPIVLLLSAVSLCVCCVRACMCMGCGCGCMCLCVGACVCVWVCYVCVVCVAYVTGFGKTCIVHTSDFAHSKIYKI